MFHRNSFCVVAGIICHLGAVKSLPVLHHYADYIFSGPLGSLGSVWVSFKNRVTMKPVLGSEECCTVLGSEEYCTEKNN